MNPEPQILPSGPESSLPVPALDPSVPVPPAFGRKPTGKIAELPKIQRNLINQMLDDGATYGAVETEMAKHGVSLNGENISNWFQNGFQQYLRHQAHIAEMRLLRENASDLVQDYNVVQFHQAANQLAVGQIFKALTQQQLIDDPTNYVRTLNALARLSRAALVLKQCEDLDTKAAAPATEPEPIHDLETQRKLLLAAFEGATGIKAAPGPIGPDLNEHFAHSRRSDDANSIPSSSSSPAAPKLPGEGGASNSYEPCSTQQEPVYSPHLSPASHPSHSPHPASSIEHPASASFPIENQNGRTSLVSKIENFEPCPECFSPLPPLLPSGERISPHCSHCGASLRSPGALIEYCPHCNHLLPELNSSGHRPAPDCPRCNKFLPPPPNTRSQPETFNPQSGSSLPDAA